MLPAYPQEVAEVSNLRVYHLRFRCFVFQLIRAGPFFFRAAALHCAFVGRQAG